MSDDQFTKLFKYIEKRFDEVDKRFEKYDMRFDHLLTALDLYSSIKKLRSKNGR